MRGFDVYVPCVNTACFLDNVDRAYMFRHPPWLPHAGLAQLFAFRQRRQGFRTIRAHCSPPSDLARLLAPPTWGQYLGALKAARATNDYDIIKRCRSTESSWFDRVAAMVRSRALRAWNALLRARGRGRGRSSIPDVAARRDQGPAQPESGSGSGSDDWGWTRAPYNGNFRPQDVGWGGLQVLAAWEPAQVARFVHDERLREMLIPATPLDMDMDAGPAA
jgi:hypothetical protein